MEEIVPCRVVICSWKNQLKVRCCEIICRALFVLVGGFSETRLNSK